MFVKKITSAMSAYYWMINQYTYVVNDTEIPKGRMAKLKYGDRTIVSDDWRPATTKEIEAKQWYKGYYFCLLYV